MLRHAFSDRHKSLSSLCQELNIKEKDLVSAAQIHHDGIAIVTPKHRGQRISKVDALVTAERGLPLAVRTADCAPILILDPVKAALALVHAGRKGTELGIAFKTIQTLTENFKSIPKDLRVKIGPCIAPCCYPMDLRRENTEQLRQAGVLEENIEIHPECTCCRKDKYFSYRGDGPDTGRMFLVAWL